MAEDRAVGEEASDLELRVDALFEAPEQLQDEPVAEGHRGVALIAPAELGLERSLSAEPREPFGPRADEAAALAARHPSAFDHLQERGGQRRIPERRPRAARPRRASRPCATTNSGPMSSPSRLPDERERVGGGFALGERHVDEGDDAAQAVAVGALDADRVRDRHRGDLPALRAEPSLPDEESGQRSLERRSAPAPPAPSPTSPRPSGGHGRRATSSSRSSAWSRNQK